MLAELAGEVTQLLGQARPRIVGVGALGGQVVGHLIEPGRLPGRRFTHLLLLGDDGVLRVGEEDDRHQEQEPDEPDGGGSAREPRSEQVDRRGPQRGDRVEPLTSDEPVGVGRLVDARMDVGSVVVVARRGRGREHHGQLERARHAIAEPRLRVYGEGRLAEAGAGADARDQPAGQRDQRDGRADEPGGLQRDDPGDRPQDELGDDCRGDDQPATPDEATHPEPPPVRQ